MTRLPTFLTTLDYDVATEAIHRENTRLAFREMSLPCSCGIPASFCPAHGEYTPATDDLEIMVEVLEASRSRNVATRVIRKPVEK